jgi:hypothetical protein
VKLSLNARTLNDRLTLRDPRHRVARPEWRAVVEVELLRPVGEVAAAEPSPGRVCHGKARRLGLLGGFVNEDKYIFLVGLVAHFFKTVCGLYEKMECSDENTALGNRILARNFLKKLF